MSSARQWVKNGSKILFHSKTFCYFLYQWESPEGLFLWWRLSGDALTLDKRLLIGHSLLGRSNKVNAFKDKTIVIIGVPKCVNGEMHGFTSWMSRSALSISRGHILPSTYEGEISVSFVSVMSAHICINVMLYGNISRSHLTKTHERRPIPRPQERGMGSFVSSNLNTIYLPSRCCVMFNILRYSPALYRVYMIEYRVMLDRILNRINCIWKHVFQYGRLITGSESWRR